MTGSGGTFMPISRGRVLGLVVVALTLTVVVGSAWWPTKDGRDWEHGGDAVQVTARIAVADNQAELDAASRTAGIRDQYFVRRSDEQVYLVDVEWTGATPSVGSFEFVLLDHRLDPPGLVPGMAVYSDAGGRNGSGWNSEYAVLAEHYDWLARAARRETSGGPFLGHSDQSSVSLPVTESGGGTLVLFLPKDQLPTEDPVEAFFCCLRLHQRGARNDHRPDRVRDLAALDRIRGLTQVGYAGIGA